MARRKRRKIPLDAASAAQMLRFIRDGRRLIWGASAPKSTWYA
jgi:hypothetical protein